MPYFISDSNPDCSGWAVEKDDGEVIGCHTTKQAAIDQMVAVSIAEEMEPGGERARPDELMVGDYVSWNSSGGRARGEIQEIFRSGTVRVPGTDFELEASEDDPVALIQIYERVEGGWEDTDVIVGHKFSTLTRIGELEEPEDEPEDEDEDEMEDRELPTNYRPAITADVPANRNCGNCGHFKNFYCKRWDAEVSPAYYCNAWEPVKGLPNDNPGQTVQTGNVNDEDPQYSGYNNIMDRQLSFDVPSYIRQAARKGLDYYGQGLGGDGLVARTVREAREMAAGRISEDKVIRANAWGARHLVDLEAPQNSNADSDGFPGAGAVAFYLWGINPLDPSPAMQWFERQAEKVREAEDRELRKDQPRDRLGRFASTAGGGAGAGEAGELPGGPNNPRPGMGDIKVSDSVARDMASGSAGPHLIKNEAGEWEFTPERQAMHDKIVSEAVDGVPRSAEPTYYVMGGGPAAGKSTMLRDGGVDVPQGKQAVQVNADDVKTQLPEYKSMTNAGDVTAAAFSHEESSYLAKRIQAAGMERGTDVVLDGTGDSTAGSIGGKIDSARSQGYKVVGNYATVPTDIAVQRANERGRKTGRFVPESVIRATHSGVSSVFPQVAGKFDEVNLFDTTGRPKLLARGRKGKLEIVDQEGYSAFLAKAGG